jgi:hypothetical protein
MPNRTVTVAVATLAVAAALAGQTLSAQKSAPASPDWPCVITFDSILSYTDAAGNAQTVSTAVQGDGKGPYVNGKEGVQCYVIRGTSISGNYGNLFVNADRSSARSFWFPAQSAISAFGRTSYTGFRNRQPGYFEITRIDTAVDGTYRRRVRIGVGGSSQFDAGEMWGDSLSTDPLVVGSSSAWVTSVAGGCSWKLAWYPWAPLDTGESAYVAPRVLALREGSSRARTRTADFSMPFSATVTITGVKPGCGTP